MKVLQIHTPYRFEGGEDKIVEQEAAQLRLRGHEVVQHHVPNPTGQLATIGALATSPWNRQAARDVKAVVSRVEPDVAHLHNTWFRLSPSVPQMIHDLGVPLAMTLHNYRLLCVNPNLLRDGRVCEDCVGKTLWRGVVHRCYRESAALSAVAAASVTMGRVRNTWTGAIDRYIAPSAFVAGKLTAGGVPTSKIVVKPHGAPDPGPRAAPPSESKVVLYVGRLSPEKGVRPLMDAWAAARVSGLTLSIVGEGPLRASLEGLHVPGVSFLGARGPDEVRSLMLSARALVFPSICYEGAPVVVTEALAAGLPVMAGGLGSAGQIAQQVGAGWVAVSMSGSSWVTALARLGNPEFVDAGGGGARELYEAEYTLEHTTTGLLGVYAEAIMAAGRSVPRWN